MSEPWFEEWVEKAEADYRAAAALDLTDLPDVVCFPCQQCVEKYLKAALVNLGILTRKTHNLTVLNDLVAGEDPRFRELQEDLDFLNPFSVVGRYPGFSVTTDDARKALDMARQPRLRIRGLLDFEADSPSQG
jgi:HEPN domain-containing protein